MQTVTEQIPAAESILVIEEDESVRSLIVKVLEQEGYSCESCGNSREGIELIREGNFRLVLTNWCLVDATGPKVVAWINSHRPDQKYFIVTGSPAFPLQAGFPLEVVIEKPFHPSQLTESVRRAMAAFSA